ncbi:MAG TPA: tRNA (adenosine(37)-N6)-threonylcarbamoyltransferase complex dimerization subunit type 1 TsaB [Pyrinomonadaceae bacterium]|nr:tRNA (adenosine(37)-N6)-threonylcarbamoyltransferase complex dimerization subunit type 1 TsaB [Pyrinomonadaceae bacterium]
MSASDEPLILSLETATRAGSIALVRGARLLSARAGDALVSHSTHLLENVRAVLADARLSLKEVELFAVASGPGSFTGLRIGLATVKSFAATLGRPSIGVPTLYAIALAAGPSIRTLAMMTAGRGEVYAQLLAVESSEGGGRGGGVGVASVRPLGEPQHVSPQRLLASLEHTGGLKLAGEGLHLYAEEIRAYARAKNISLSREGEPVEGATAETVSDEWTLAAPIENLAVHVASLARGLFEGGERGSPEELRAIYVRPSDAELNEQCRAQNQPAG